MKILLISAYFPPDTGSAANLFYDLGKKLIQKGFSVTVLTSFPSYHVTGDIEGYNGQKMRREQVDGLSVIRIRVPQFPRYIPAMRALWQFSMAHCFSRSIKNIEKHDVALVYSPPLPLGFTGASLSKLWNIPYVLNVQDLFPQSAIDLNLLKNSLLIKFFRFLERKIYKPANHITVHSAGNKDHVINVGFNGENVTIMPNWIDTDYLQPGEKNNPFSREHALMDKFVVSFAGVIGYSQDVDVILDGADQLREKKDIQFVIVGDGVEKDRLIRKSRDMGLGNIMFLPMQPRNIYSQVLHSSDVCLSTLNKEVQTPVVPSKILSIMASGKPLIACMNTEGDAPKIVKKANCGFIFSAGDHKGLVSAILILYNSPELCDEYGKNGRKYCIENFSLDICTDKYIRLFKQIVK